MSDTKLHPISEILIKLISIIIVVAIYPFILLFSLITGIALSVVLLFGAVQGIITGEPGLTTSQGEKTDEPPN